LYEDPGDYSRSYLGRGGYVVELREKVEETRSQKPLSFFGLLKGCDLEKKNLKSLLAEFVMVSRNYEAFIYITVAFDFDGAGHVIPRIHADSI